MTARRLALLLLLAAPAAARAPDGTLDLIVTPNSGAPVIVESGGVFEAELLERAALRLLGPDETAVALDPAWTDLPGGRVRARCPLPGDVAPGTYTLEAAEGARRDRNPRSVYVREQWPADYLVAHVTDVHIGKERTGESPEAAFRRVIAAVDASGADFVLVTGDITERGDADEFRGFLELLDTCALPTFVCAGNHDRGRGVYERFFGPTTYMFRFGRDGYLVFDTKDYLVADDLDPRLADLHRFRRAIKPARWSIGVSHRYWADMGMRAQLTLFVDDPLDVLIFGHWHRGHEDAASRVPWGTTPIIATPVALDGAWRLIVVTEISVLPQPAQTAGSPAP